MNELEFYQNFTQDMLARSGAEENFTRSVFLEYMCSILEQEGMVSGYDIAEHKAYADKKHIAVDAWSYDIERSCLFLILADYRSSEALERLINTEIKKKFRMLRNFVVTALDNSFKKELEESDPVTQLAWLIGEEHHHNRIAKIHLILVSNAILSSKVAELPEEIIDNYPTSYDIWDLGRVYRLETSGRSREVIDISFGEIAEGGLPCLKVHTDCEDIESYIVVIPGSVLADLYEEHGERLLEQNVRTFLQFRGKVNKGIRNTVVNEPHMFFSYNNGLAATAESVTTSNDGALITSVRNLQIVNGGQTTASLFNARKKEKANLSSIYVQIKLSVINIDILEEVVPKISEYANTQNKVSAADFFSNHKFHRRIEEFSRRIWAPASEGSIEQTHWFYERARGQYANKQVNLTAAEKRKFLIQNPKKQMFTKTDLAKFILSFEEAPHEVSLGAQKAFSGTPSTKGLVKRVAEKWDKDDKEFNELWFKQAIAKAIIFKEVDKMIFQSPWYQGYKANIVTYTIAKLCSVLRKRDLTMDYLMIWDTQEVPRELMAQLCAIAERVNEVILYPEEGITSNSSEWSKKLMCWEAVKDLRIELSGEVMSYCITTDEKSQNERDAKKTQKMYNGINDQTYVVNKGSDHWAQLRDWNRVNNILSPTELSILNIACSIPNKIPSDKQSMILIRAEERAKTEGFFSG
ncbi:MAG: AIPR family protein [Dehalococcoidales bacterium]|jgi:hypothetical protein|nr:AIPR family protein [Dehalococcoidales bacterium]